MWLVALRPAAVSRQLRLAYLAPEVLKRLVYGREGPAAVLDLSDCAARPWTEQAGTVFAEDVCLCVWVAFGFARVWVRGRNVRVSIWVFFGVQVVASLCGLMRERCLCDVCVEFLRSCEFLRGGCSG